MAQFRGGKLIFRSRIVYLALVLLATLPGVVQAQQYFDPGLLQQTFAQRPADFQPPGIRAGSFIVSTGANFAYEYNDNVFYTPTMPLSDSIWHLSPYLNVNSDWNRHALNFNAAADLARYDEFGQNDYNDWTTRVDGRVDVKQNSWLSLDASFYHLHEDRRDPSAGGPATPTEFDYGGYGAGYDHIFNRLKVGAYYNYNAFDYDNNVTSDGEFIDNADRNRSQDRYVARADYQLGPETAVFGNVGWNSISYDQPVDDNGYERDSDGRNYGVGVAWDMTDLLTGDLSLNWYDQSYEDPRLPDVDGWGLGAGLNWTPRETTFINVRFATSPQETNQAGISGYMSRFYSARWQEQVRHNLLFNLRASFTDNDYVNPGETSDLLSVTEVTRMGIGMSYLFNRYFYVSGGYSYETQDSNVGEYDYNASRLFLNLGVDL